MGRLLKQCELLWALYRNLLNYTMIPLASVLINWVENQAKAFYIFPWMLAQLIVSNECVFFPNGLIFNTMQYAVRLSFVTNIRLALVCILVCRCIFFGTEDEIIFWIILPPHLYPIVRGCDGNSHLNLAGLFPCSLQLRCVQSAFSYDLSAFVSQLSSLESKCFLISSHRVFPHDGTNSLDGHDSL